MTALSTLLLYIMLGHFYIESVTSMVHKVFTSLDVTMNPHHLFN